MNTNVVANISLNVLFHINSHQDSTVMETPDIKNRRSLVENI